MRREANGWDDFYFSPNPYNAGGNYDYTWDWYDDETDEHETWRQNGIDWEDWLQYLDADSRDFKPNGHAQTIYCTLYNEDGSVEDEQIFHKFASKKAHRRHATRKAASVIKIREFIKMDIDIDVVDDYCEELYIAFCGPLGLTAAGETAWADVLDMDIDITHIGGYDPIAVVLVEDSEQKMKRAKDFFESVAGFCPASDWDKWFVFE